MLQKRISNGMIYAQLTDRGIGRFEVFTCLPQDENLCITYNNFPLINAISRLFSQCIDLTHNDRTCDYAYKIRPYRASHNFNFLLLDGNC